MEGNERRRYKVGTGRRYRRGVRGIRRNKRSVLILLMSVELMLLAVNRGFVGYGVYRDDRRGERRTRMVLTVAASESAVGLAVLVVYYRVHGTIAMKSMNVLHG
jgi:NADH-quinone oxidoreductase subunit K